MTLIVELSFGSRSLELLINPSWLCRDEKHCHMALSSRQNCTSTAIQDLHVLGSQS